MRRDISPRNRVMEVLVYWLLTDKLPSLSEPLWMEVAEKCLQALLRAASAAMTVEAVAELVAEAYGLMERVCGPYEAVEVVPYVGELRPEEAERGRLRKRESMRVKFRGELAKLVNGLPECEEVRIEVPRLQRAPYGETAKRRIANLRALEYTRLGPPIRHLSGLLARMEARTKLLITLSDGKPDDYDGYNGDYGIEDTRMALVEAKTKGIHPFCITIDKAEHGYLSHMYGAVNYTFIDDISKLPLKVPEIYRKLTT